MTLIVIPWVLIPKSEKTTSEWVNETRRITLRHYGSPWYMISTKLLLFLSFHSTMFIEITFQLLYLLTLKLDVKSIIHASAIIIELIKHLGK